MLEFKSYSEKIIIIGGFIVILLVIINIIVGTVKSSFNNVPERVPPHINELKFSEQIPQTNLRKSENANNAPNYGTQNKHITNTVNMRPGEVYRQKTGRDAFEAEQYVSIYDANFGGIIPTTLGLSKD